MKPRELDEAGQALDYQDWSPQHTRVVSGPLGDFRFPGRVFPDLEAARAFWSAHTRIIAEHHSEGRWAFRIPASPLALPGGNMRTRLDAKRFVLVWQSCNSIKAVAEEMGMTPYNANNYAARLRRAGVNLKNMRYGNDRYGAEVDVDALNKLIR